MGACCGAEVYDDPENPAGDKTQKILFLGTGGCGKSTLFRQLRRKYGKGFTNKQRTDAIRGISGFVIETMQNILTDHESDEEKAALLNTLPHEEAVRAAQYVIAADPSKTSLQTKQMTEAIRTLWAVDAIKTRFHETAKVRINTACEHFFDSLDRISDPDYVPTDTDILMQRRPTTGLIEETIDLDANDKKTRFMMVDVGGQRNERKKWIHHFADVAAVLFVCALNHYHAVLFEDEKKNALHEAIELFTEICNSKWFRKSEMILFLNKDDLFKEKIRAGISLTECFSHRKGWSKTQWGSDSKHIDYHKIPDDELADNNHFIQCHTAAINFIQEAFMEVNQNANRVIFCHVTCATDEETVQKVFWDVQNIVIRSNLRRGGLMV